MDQRIAEFDGQRRTVQEQFETNKQQLHILEASLKDAEMRQLVVEQEQSILTSRLQDVEQRLNANQTELDACQVELARVREARKPGANAARRDRTTTRRRRTTAEGIDHTISGSGRSDTSAL